MNDRSAYEKVADWLGEFLKLTFPQAAELAKFTSRSQASEFESEFSHLLNIILPGRLEAILALRLLCEAWKATKGKASSERGEIKIHAPTTLNQWLAPFGVEYEAAKAAALMGEAKDAAAALFDAVEKPKEELNKTVEAFLDATAKV